MSDVNLSESSVLKLNWVSQWICFLKELKSRLILVWLEIDILERIWEKMLSGFKQISLLSASGNLRVNGQVPIRTGGPKAASTADKKEKKCSI